MNGKEKCEAGKRCAAWVSFEINDWIEEKAGEKKWSKSFFIAEILREAMSNEARRKESMVGGTNGEVS